MASLLDRLPAAMIMPGTTIRTRTIVLVTLPVLLAVALALLWYRSQRVLGLDAYYYVEYTKVLAQQWPDVFGSNWPRGYPLLAAALTHIGLSPYLALTLISGLSILAMTIAGANLLPRDLRWSWITFAVFCAACSVPAVPLLLGMPMSELLFAALLLLSVALVRRWPARWAIWLSLFLGFSSFCIRYAGIFIYGLLALLLVLQFQRLRDEKRLLFAGGWYAFFVLLTGFLLWSNIQATGHISGADRGFGGGLAVVPEQIAHLGWSAIGAVTSTQIDELIGGVASLPGLIIGWMVMGGIAAVCGRAVLAPKNEHARPLALLVLSYLGAFVAMRALRHFPDINEPRYFVPVLFPLALVLLLETRLQAQKLIGVAAAVAVVIGVGLSLRGISQATYGDVSFARDVMAAELEADDIVMVNDGAVSLSAYLDNPFQWERCGLAEIDEPADYVVVAGRSTHRAGGSSQLDECGRRLIDQARRDGYRVWHRSGVHVILQRDPSLATSFSGISEK